LAVDWAVVDTQSKA
jgi:hypothetical protein